MTSPAKHNPMSRFSQRGYLLEIPILIVVALLVFAAIFPALPPLGQQALIVLVAAVIVFGLYYMVVVPGWMPGDKARLGPPWNMLAFLVLAAMIIVAAVAIIFGIKS